MEFKCSYDKLVSIQDLIPHPDNPNQHSEDQIKRLAKIIDYQGQRSPIVIDNKTGFIVVGHGRWEAMKLLKWEEVAVNYQDFENETQVYAHMTADNAIAEWADLDLTQINLKCIEIGDELDIDFLGLKDFSVELVEEIEPQTDEDEVPEVKEAITKRGDVWLLGEHRVMCGDSTMIDDVEKLMKGDKADMVFTDPPYGVSYTEKNEFLNSIGKPLHINNAIKNDSKKPDEMYDFWLQAFSNIHMALKNKASYYFTAPQGGDLLLLLQAVQGSGFQLKHILCWVKNNHVLGRCDYHYKHEPIVYGWKQNHTHVFYGKGDKKFSTWDFPRPLKNDLHPTMKPIAIMENAAMNSSKENDLIIDFFLGSGSTLIACEKTKRKCYGMELDEKYCDVVINRWQNYIGKDAILESTGKTYNSMRGD